MAPTPKHRLASRRSAKGYDKTQRLLTAGEESILLWRCDILQGLQAPADVRALALGIAKLNKHSATGKLPVQRHTPSRIEEDIGKGRTKLGELQAEPREHESQASGIASSS